MHVHERRTHRLHANERHAHEKHAHERHVRSIHVPKALTASAEEEQLEPFYKLLEGSAGASEVNNSEV